MAIPEHAYAFHDAPLTPGDVTAEVIEMFHQHCQATELSLVHDVLREPLIPIVETRVSAGEEADIFWAAFEEL
jgi:hypothetical protein